jgi:flagellar motor switch protein FliN/FliY
MSPLDEANAVLDQAAEVRGGGVTGRLPRLTSSRTSLQRILWIEVPVIVRLARREMPLREILQLTPGSVIELFKPADEHLDLLTNNHCIGHGTAVKVGEHYGVRLTKVGTIEERVQAMGPD